MSAAREAIEIINGAIETKISFATLTWLDLPDYNNRSRRTMSVDRYRTYCATTKKIDATQNLLNKSIIAINRQLVALDKDNKIPTTWAVSRVHAYHNKSYHHYYGRLSDGCHTHPDTRQYRANQIIKTIKAIHSQTIGN